MISSKPRTWSSIAAASSIFVFTAATIAIHGSGEQQRAQTAGSTGDLVALFETTGANASDVLIGNRVISARLPVDSGKPTALEVRALRDGHSIRLNGPFRIALEKDEIVEPATMTLLEPGRIEKLTANSDATVAAEKLPGVAVHYKLGDPAGRFTVDWAVVMRKDAHYIRQLLTITAGKEDVAITRVGLIDTTAPQMKLTGTVKGSPLTAGDFFLGFEHPLSTSSVVHERGVAEMERVLPLRAGQR